MMNSLWNEAADQVTKVWQVVAAHPFGTFCWAAAAGLVTIGVRQIIKGSREEHRRYLEQKAVLDALPDPPMMGLARRSHPQRDPN